MESVFSSNNKLFNAVEKCMDLIKLNLLWMLFCIPVVTAGASTCALHEMASKMAAGEDGYVLKPFVRAFRRYFVRATKVWIPFLLAGAGIAADVLFWMGVSGGMAMVMRGVVTVMGALYLLLSVYLFPLVVRTETSWSVLIRNCVLLTFKYLPRTLYMVLWLLIVFFAGRVWALGMWIVFFAGGSGVALIHAHCLNRIFEKEEKMNREAENEV